MTVAFAESPLAVWNQPDGSVTGVTDCAVLQLAGFPTLKHSVTDGELQSPATTQPPTLIIR